MTAEECKAIVRAQFNKYVFGRPCLNEIEQAWAEAEAKEEPAASVKEQPVVILKPDSSATANAPAIATTAMPPDGVYRVAQ